MFYRFFAFLQMTFLIAGFVSCGSTEKASTKAVADTSFYFAGGYVYFADAAVLADCATGVAIPVAQKGASIDVERRYLGMNPSEAEPIFVEFMGHIVREALVEGEGLHYAVVVDSLIGFDRTVGCNPEASVPGLYEAQMDSDKMNITLGSDYTFTQRMFKLDNQSEDEIFTGEWACLSADKIILMYKDVNGKADNRKSFMTFDFETKVLTEMVDSNQIIYRKVYL